MATVSSSEVPAARVLCLCGPSGVGKGTLHNMLREEFSQITFSVSHTSRPSREGEVDGSNYYFVNKDEFENMIQQNLFIEYAEFAGKYYGTSIKGVEKILESPEKICLLELDIQGVASVMKSSLHNVTKYIFISSPSVEELRHRLRTRGSETEELINRRIIESVEQIEIARTMPFNIELVNNDIDECYGRLKSYFQDNFHK